jgi:hypothetical protein
MQIFGAEQSALLEVEAVSAMVKLASPPRDM